MELRPLQIKWTTPVLKAKVAAEADATGKSMNDVAVAILAAKFGVPFEAVGGPPRARTEDADTTLLRVPVRLYSAIDQAASNSPIGQRHMTTLVGRVLCEHYGLPWSPPVRTRRRRTATA